VARCRGHDDGVVRSAFLPAVIAVAELRPHALVAQRAQPFGRLQRERLDNLDRADRAHELGQYRCLIARSRADFEHRVIGLEVHEIGHQRDDVRLRNRLAMADGEGAVFVGIAYLTDRYEAMTGHRADDRHDTGVEGRTTRLFRRFTRERGDLFFHMSARIGVFVLRGHRGPRGCRDCERGEEAGAYHGLGGHRWASASRARAQSAPIIKRRAPPRHKST
jgi:hypothetical protein